MPPAAACPRSACAERSCTTPYRHRRRTSTDGAPPRRATGSCPSRDSPRRYSARRWRLAVAPPPSVHVAPNKRRATRTACIACRFNAARATRLQLVHAGRRLLEIQHGRAAVDLDVERPCRRGTVAIEIADRLDGRGLPV